MSAYSIMGKRIDELNEIAQHGNIEAFYNLATREDVRILEDIDEVPFVDTPLHIAASAGGPQHIQFAMEMMRLKPSFARKPNLNGYSPIHLALQEGHTQMVHRLLQVDRDLVRVKGKEGRTPLHDVAAAAATEPQLDLLFKFLSGCPNSIEDVTIQNQTALHISLENNNFDAFKRLVRWLRTNKTENVWEILNRQDEEGNTVLHVAVSKNQTKAVSHLLAWGGRSVYLNEKNLKGKTAFDILQEQSQEVDNSEMRAILECAGALTASSLPTVTSYTRSSRLPVCCERAIILIIHQLEGITDERRDALLVVAALLITVTYQAALSPPGGLWQDDLFKPNTTTAALSPPSPAGGLLNESNSNITAPHRAGSAIAKRTDFFTLFFACNTLIFLLSNVIMVVLVPPVEIIGFFLACVCLLLCSCYVISLLLIVEAPKWTLNFVPYLPFIIFVVAVAMALFYSVLGSARIPLSLKGIRALLNLIWKRIKRKVRAELGAVCI